MALESPIWKIPFTLNGINQRGKGTLSEHLGIEFTEIGAGHLSATMSVDNRTIQPMGALHGGASCALAETVGSAAANFCVDSSKYICVGLDININHIRPIQSGKVTAIATPLHLGKTTQVWEIKIYNEEKKMISAGRLTIAVMPFEQKKTPSLST